VQQVHYHVHDEDNIHTRNVVIALGLGLKHSLIVSPVSSEFIAMDKCSIISHEASDETRDQYQQNLCAATFLIRLAVIVCAGDCVINDQLQLLQHRRA
jgi:hypothetical protein